MKRAYQTKKTYIPKEVPHKVPDPLEIADIRNVITAIDTQIHSCCSYAEEVMRSGGKSAPIGEFIKDTLFSIPEWNVVGETYRQYMLNRSIRIDRDTGVLIRGNITVVLTDEEGPAYTIECYVTKNFNAGAIIVIPMSGAVPNMRNTVLYPIVDGAIEYEK